VYLPITIGDNTDFYRSYEHAFNCGTRHAVNWNHLPVAHNGVESSVAVSASKFGREPFIVDNHKDMTFLGDGDSVRTTRVAKSPEGCSINLGDAKVRCCPL
jgi:hypothetical protein